VPRITFQLIFVFFLLVFSAHTYAYTTSGPGTPVLVAGEMRTVNPLVLNRFSAFDTGVSNTWTSVENNQSMKRNYDFLAWVGLHDWNFSILNFTFGPYVRFQMPQSVTNKGVSSTGSINVEKKTTLSGYLLGGQMRGEFSLFLGLIAIADLGIGAGIGTLSQSIIAGTATSSLSANAFTAELLGSGGLRYPFAFLDLEARVGYARQRSSVYTVKSTEGTLYNSLKEGDAMKVTGNGKIEDLRLDRSGVFYSLGVSKSL
jgi:hypothetical protein